MRLRRQGFTLVELLVVIAIIGVLMSLLLPAVQAARESGRRTHCANNLRQFGIAFQTHHDTYQFFPSGGYDWTYAPDFAADGTPEIAPRQRAGWGFQILNFIEQRSVWEGGGETTNDGRQRQAVGAKIPTFFCSSRRRPQAITGNPGYNNGSPGNCPHAMTDYAACDYVNDGVVVRTSVGQDWLNQGPITTADIRDGTSNTMCVGEKRLNVAALGTIQTDDDQGYTAGWDHDTMRRTDYAPRPDTLGTPNYGEYRFGSSHPGGFQATFADASVHFIPYEVDLTVFRRMGCRRDGETFRFP